MPVPGAGTSTGSTAKPQLPMPGKSSWIAGAIAESALPGTAWSLVETEFLETFAERLEEDHPSLCAAAAGESKKDVLFAEVCARAPEPAPSPNPCQDELSMTLLALS